MITDILECITDEINVNFPSASEVLYDENIFASYGFPGCIMALDFQKITINGIFLFLLIGVNYAGQFRMIELIDGSQSEANALKSSEFFSELLKENYGKHNWPASFQICTNKNERQAVAPYVVVDQQVMAEFWQYLPENRKINLLVPCAWKLQIDRHSYYRSETYAKVAHYI